MHDPTDQRHWLIEGCLDWQAHGLEPSPEVVNVTARYRDADDILGRFARDVGRTFAEGLHVAAAQLAGELDKWCRGEGIVDSPNRNDFADWMRLNGAENIGRKTVGGVRGTWWRNVAIDETLGTPTEPPTAATPATPFRDFSIEPLHGEVLGRVRQQWQEPTQTATTPVCPRCGKPTKAIYPSDLCGDCDAEQVAP